MTNGAPIRMHWMRHGRVASHRGDIPVTDEGLRELEAAGRRLPHLRRSTKMAAPPVTSAMDGSVHPTRLKPLLAGAMSTRSPYTPVKASMISCAV